MELKNMESVDPTVLQAGTSVNENKRLAGTDVELQRYGAEVLKGELVPLPPYVLEIVNVLVRRLRRGHGCDPLKILKDSRELLEMLSRVAATDDMRLKPGEDVGEQQEAHYALQLEYWRAWTEGKPRGRAKRAGGGQ